MVSDTRRGQTLLTSFGGEFHIALTKVVLKDLLFSFVAVFFNSSGVFLGFFFFCFFFFFFLGGGGGWFFFFHWAKFQRFPPLEKIYSSVISRGFCSKHRNGAQGVIAIAMNLCQYFFFNLKM